MLLLCCYFFFRKKDNQKKGKVLRMTRGSAYRAGDTATHPYILYLWHFHKPILSRISFFSSDTRFPDKYPTKRVCFRAPRCLNIFFGLPQVHKAWRLWRKFPLYRAIFHPTFSLFPAENHLFFSHVALVLHWF